MKVSTTTKIQINNKNIDNTIFFIHLILLAKHYIGILKFTNMQNGEKTEENNLSLVLS